MNTEKAIKEETKATLNKEEKHITHIVKKGEDLLSITAKYYGSIARVNVIRKVNDLPTNNVKVGRKIKVPTRYLKRG